MDTSGSKKIETVAQHRYEEDSDVRRLGVLKEKDDTKVDIVADYDFTDHHLVEDHCQDAAEYSSSFDGTENGSALSDHEPESQLANSYPSPASFDGLDKPCKMRKKALTGHWKRFIRPLMWRCKWTELKIKEFKFQVQKYESELREYRLTKQFALEKKRLEGYDTKLLCLPCQPQRTQVMKRKRRNQVEKTVDIASHMSSHNLFSYFENRKANPLNSAVYNRIDCRTKSKDETDSDDEQLDAESTEEDIHLMEHLKKIEVAASQTQKLKSRVDKLLKEHVPERPPVDKLTTSLSSSGQNHACPLENEHHLWGRTTGPSSLHTGKINTGSHIVPAATDPRHEQSDPCPSAMILGLEEPFMEAPSHIGEEGSLLEDEITEEELDNFERVINQVTRRARESAGVNPPSIKPRVRKRKKKRAITFYSRWKRRPSS